jgi:hypothetical protein
VVRRNNADLPRLDPAWDLWTAEQRALRGEAIPAQELAGLIECVGTNPLPEWLRERVCARLRGKRAKQGRPRRDNEWENQLLHLADWDYRRILSILQKSTRRKKAPPHEVAAKLVHRFYKRAFQEFKHIDLPHFRNLLSSVHRKR